MYTIHSISLFDYTTNTPNEYWPYAHDEFMPVTGWDAARNQFSVDKPNQPFNGIISDEAIEAVIKRASKNISEPERALHDKTVNKYYAPRGGSFSEETGISNLPEYYIHRDTDERIMREVREIMLQYTMLTRQDTRIGDPYIHDYGELLQTWKGDHKSGGGLSHPEDRRTEGASYDACLQAWQDPLCLDPIRGGNRRMDGKIRQIHIDSFANYFREAAVFHKIFEYIRNCGWNHTYSVKDLATGIINLKAKDGYGGDYKMMDGHQGELATRYSAHMICDWTHVPFDKRQYMMDMIHELFHSKLVFGKFVYCGENNLWSGIYPTHDIESPENYAMLVATATKMGFKVVILSKDPATWRPLRKNEVAIIVCGDDSIVLFGRKLTDNERKQFGLLHAFIAKGFGQELELSKVDWGDQYLTFCKRTYALRAGIASYKYYEDRPTVPVPKYDVLKAVCALRHPEHIPHFPHKSDLVIWFCAIMDNAYGNQDWKGTVIEILQHNPDLFSQFDYSDTTISDETMSVLKEDWWLSQFGNLDLAESPTFKLLKQYCYKEA
jgi:hypothetical protein